MVVVGTGVAAAATGGASTATWTGLLENGVDRCVAVAQPLPQRWAERTREQIASGDLHELLLAAESVSRRLGAPDGGEYRRWLREAVGALWPVRPELLTALRDLDVPLATTNYDGLIEQVTGWPAVTWRDGPRVERVLRGDEPGVLHLHGHWQDPRSVVLGIRSYEDVLGSAHAQSVQQALRLFNSLVFVGFGGGLADPNFGTFLRWTRTVFGGSEYRHFRLARADDAGRLQQEHPPDERIVVLPYGARHEDLVSFLRALRPVDAPAEPGRPAERTGLTDLERRILRTLFARYPEDDSINVRSVGEVEHVADPGSPHLWDLHREPGLLEALARLNDLMLIKFEVSESGFARAILLPDGISALRGEYRDHTSPPLVLVVGVPDGTTGTRSVGPRPLSDAVEIEIGKEWYPSTAAVPVVDETRDDAAVGALSEAIRTGEVLGSYGVLRIVNSGDIDLARCKVVLTRLQRYDPDPASLAWKEPAWFGQAGGHALHWSAAHGGGAVQSLGPQEVRSCDFVCFEDMGHDHALIVTADDGLRSTRKLDFGLWRATCRVEADGWAPVDVRLRLRWDREPQPGIPRALNIRLDEE